MFVAVALVSLLAFAGVGAAAEFGQVALDFRKADEPGQWRGVGGQWLFEEGSLRQQKADEYWCAYLRDGSLADLALSLRCKLAEVHQSYPAAGYVVIAFRAQSPRNYYSLHLKATGELALAEYCSRPSEGRRVWQPFGKTHRLVPGKLPLDAWYRVDLEVIGPRVRARAYPVEEAAPGWQIEADLSQALPIDHSGDKAHLIGQIGFGTSNCRALITDVRLDARPSPVLLKAPLARATELAQRLANAVKGTPDEAQGTRMVQSFAAFAREIDRLESVNTARYQELAARLNLLQEEQAGLRRKVLVARGGIRGASTYAEFLTFPQRKANLHCHTRHSDGSLPCNEMAAWYEENGYQIVALSDHDAYGDQDGGVCSSFFQKDQAVHDWDGDGVTHPTREYRSGVEAYVRDYDKPAPPWVPRDWKLNRPGEFVVLNSMESSFGHHHTNVIEPPTGKIPRPREGYGFIDWCHGNNGLVFVVHPGGWNKTPERILDHPEMRKIDGLEVMNGFTARENRKGENPDGSKGIAEELWDACLDAGKLLWGFANDDAHNTKPDHYAGAGSAWNMVWVRELTKPAVMESLRRGAFYASCGIQIDRVEMDAESITVRSPNATHIKVVGDGGRTLAQVDANQITYRLQGTEKWIRVVLWNDTICYPNEPSRYPQRAWLQPIVLDSLIP